MFDALKGLWGNLSRRDLISKAGLLAAAQAAGISIPRTNAAPLEIGSEMYRSIGVRQRERPECRAARPHRLEAILLRHDRDRFAAVHQADRPRRRGALPHHRPFVMQFESHSRMIPPARRFGNPAKIDQCFADTASRRVNDGNIWRGARNAFRATAGSRPVRLDRHGWRMLAGPQHLARNAAGRPRPMWKLSIRRCRRNRRDRRRHVASSDQQE